MKPFFEVQPVEAVWALAEAVAPLPAETAPLGEASGRTLAEPFHAPHDLPGFARSSMDGYAVRARDTFGASEGEPAYLALQGEVTMGQAPAFALRPGHCARIGTGGMLPQGADAVVIVEHTREAEADLVEVSAAAAPGAHVLGPSDDAARGELLFEAGHLLRPQDIGLLAALGQSRLLVSRRPRVGILSTGDEVVPVESPLGPGQVRDVNSLALAALVRDAGGEPLGLGLVGDDPALLRAAMRRSLAEADLTILSGGSSVGARDLTAEIFGEAPDARLLVHGVSVAPGKPFLWVSTGTHNLLGLPGQVTSCQVTFHLFVEPILERLLGRAARPFLRFGRLRARLTRNIPSSPGRTLFQRVRLAPDGPAWLAEPVVGRSGLLRSLVKAHGLVQVPLGTEGFESSSMVEVLVFPGERLPWPAASGGAPTPTP
ncbi:MAG: molybdopterin molybdotransferase MoeA [Polyangia bacterium]|jgi:molybdopterin molybdotransferase|nr:molybdopterin molybdotransferase MoeA [Polyangia bacterium]